MIGLTIFRILSIVFVRYKANPDHHYVLRMKLKLMQATAKITSLESLYVLMIGEVSQDSDLFGEDTCTLYPLWIFATVM